ncbi:BQ5605_C001g00337 [Microbotryum silenes-dioicae]|uniref:BQ5605_C001g00337 protein n=1 Tax=Microbotryum silenes-dioicae TaxID=796604 RepID=A0A2X0M788_9BASI|nr:BQ5605_C001g00337 [Microbotryum silenes-dioicae]
MPFHARAPGTRSSQHPISSPSSKYVSPGTDGRAPTLASVPRLPSQSQMPLDSSSPSAAMTASPTSTPTPTPTPTSTPTAAPHSHSSRRLTISKILNKGRRSSDTAPVLNNSLPAPALTPVTVSDRDSSPAAIAIGFGFGLGTGRTSVRRPSQSSASASPSQSFVVVDRVSSEHGYWQQRNSAATENSDVDDASSGSGHSEDEEDISDLNRASSDDTSLSSPRMSPMTFLSRPRVGLDSAQQSSSTSNPVSSRTTSSDESPVPTTPPPLSARRFTQSLRLSDLSTTNQPADSSRDELEVVQETSTTSHQPVVSDVNPAASPTERRLRALPRLLSSDAFMYVAVRDSGATQGEEAAEEESGIETDQESEADTSPTPSAAPSQLPVALGAITPSAPAFGRPTIPRETSASRPQGLLSASVTSGVSTSRTPRISPAEPVQSSWVTFGSATPTPGPLRTARTATRTFDSLDSYFDLPRGATATTATSGSFAATTSRPPMTPILPMSMSNSARGRRPARQDELSASPPPTRAMERTDATALRETIGDESRAEPKSVIYQRPSHSAIDLRSPSLLDEDGSPLGTAVLTELDPVWGHGGDIATPGSSFLPVSSFGIPRIIDAHSSGSAHSRAPSPSRKLSTNQVVGSRIQRRSSMYELATEPPAYHAQYKRAGQAPQLVFPREEEGREGLPTYSCAIHLEGYMPMKKEFSAPSVQSKDRAWKRIYFVLHGTSIKIYRHDLRTHPIPGEEDWLSSVSSQDPAAGPHYHQGEYGNENPIASSHHKFSITDAKAKAKSRITQAGTSENNALLRHYSLQHAESGLAADYLKRKHVVRVRAEGEQFLLQTNGDRGTIDLIEVLQAATNVALDLDTRVLPKFITLPRRRRRRRRVVDPNANAARAAASSATLTSADGEAETTGEFTADSNPIDRLGDMLEEEQVCLP